MQRTIQRDPLQETLFIPSRLDARRMQCLHFGSEQQLVIDLGVKQRLDAKPVARRKQLPLAFIPQNKRILAPQAMDAFGAELLVEVQHDLTIRSRAEAMTPRFELCPNLLEIVKLAVHDGMNRPCSAAARPWSSQ